jgi:4-amino-4-deoxy-L-arabinose transferase-like glycosyltransferase
MVTTRSPHLTRKLAAAVAILLLAFALMTSSAIRKSATVDEQSHLFRGAAYLKTGATHFLLGHPLLGSVLSALPLLSEPDLRLPVADPAWAAGNWSVAGDRFLWGVNDAPLRLLFLGRLPVFWMTLLLGAVVFRWARELAGVFAGLLAMGVLLFDPNVLAHGRIISGDIPLTLFFLLTIYAYWHWLVRGRSWGWLVLAGAAFGLAGATKFNAALLVPMLALLGGYVAVKERSWRPVTALLVVGVTGWLLIWAVYGFRLWHGFLPGGPFWDDLFWELQYFGKPHGAYLAGKTSPDGWWYYFPVAFVLKTPLPTLLLLAAAFGMQGAALVRQRRIMPKSYAVLFLLLPMAVYFLVSMGSSLNIGYRHLLPMLPFLYIFAAVTVWAVLGRRASVILRVAAFAAPLLLLLISLVTWPNYISYFNLLAGGDGWRLLSDSNVDWGQDLPALAAWQANSGESVYLSYFGTAHPSAYGVAGVPILTWAASPEQGNPARQAYNSADPAPGWYAISVTNLHGVVLGEQRDAYAYFREREPAVKLGGSIFLYEVAERGQSANVVFSSLTPGTLAPSLHERLGTNDVQPRWFDARDSIIWPVGGGWMAVGTDEAPSLPGLAALWPAAPVAEANGQRLYALPSSPPLSWANEAVPFGDALTFLGRKYVPATEGEAALLTAWRVEKGDGERPLKLFVHAVNENDEIVGQWDGLTVSVDAWMSGDVFVQSHRFTVEEENYRLAIGVYDAETGERLSGRYFLEQ